MTETVTIFVTLLGEGVDVWRPVLAEHLQGDSYRILAQPYDSQVETWEFEPGSEVTCDWVDASDGRILVASGRRES